MTCQKTLYRLFLSIVSAALIPVVPAGASKDSRNHTRPDGITIVEINQRPCLFLESEENPQSYMSMKKADCEAINAKTAKDRTLKILKLKPGKHIFRVTNENVPYELGFYLRGQGLGRVTLPSVSGRGLATGKTKDYGIQLVKGSYYYSCPLNSTPDYTLVVE